MIESKYNTNYNLVKYKITTQQALCWALLLDNRGDMVERGIVDASMGG